MESPRPPRQWRLQDMMLVAVWCGLATGLVEVTLLAIKRFALGQVIRVSNDVVWMAPLADVVWALIAAGAVALISLAIPSQRRFPVLFTGAAATGVFAIVLHYSRMALISKALIALGVAVQIARMLARREAWFLTLVRRTAPWMAGLVVALAAGSYGWSWFQYRQAVGRLAPPRESMPNVLLIVMDTVRASSLGHYGYRRDTTPNLDRLAQSAVVFERAISPSPWTFPAHASMFTGRWPHELSANWQSPLDGTYPTLGEVLRDRGYRTAGFAANNFWCTTEFGIARGFDYYDSYPVSVSQAVMSSSIGREMISFSLDRDSAFQFREWIGYDEIPGRRSAGEINGEFLRWVGQDQGSRPFFAFLNYLDAHQPFLPPSPFDRKFLGDSPRGDPRHWWGRDWKPQEIQAETDSYDGAIGYIDQQIGALTEELQRRGLLENTLLIVTSDHGEHLGEHGFMRHANTLYLEVLHVPLMFRLPARVPALRVPEPASVRDLPATVLDVLGVDCAGCLAGSSLAASWRKPAQTQSPSSPSFSEVSRGVRLPGRYPNASGDMASLVTADFHYILNGDGSEELYRLPSDPQERTNLVNSPEAAAALADFRRRQQEMAGSARK